MTAPNIGAIDVTGVQPAAQAIVRRLARVYLDHLGPALETLVAHGAAVKGGYIRGASDVDVVAFVEPEILTSSGQLPLEQALDLHRDLARIDSAPFRYLQGYVYPIGGRPGPGFIPGTFHVVVGAGTVPIATSDELLLEARKALAALDPTVLTTRLSNALLDHGEGRLFRQMRFLCTDVWPAMYHVACVQEGDGMAAWQRTKSEVVPILGDDPIVGPPLRRWVDAVTRHYAGEETVETALDGIRAGVAFLEAAAEWWRCRASNHEDKV